MYNLSNTPISSSKQHDSQRHVVTTQAHTVQLN